MKRVSIFEALRRWMGLSPEAGNGEEGEPDRGDEDGDGPPADPTMLSCEAALSRLYEFLDGELDDLTHEQVDAHFQVCTRCYPHLAMEKSFQKALHRAVEERKAPPELKNRVLELIESAGNGSGDPG